ncbi:MAG: UDP-N-acetylmuramoyl-L-alanyl-D-glutamate--2,6-diaminopimelate ligase [Burkholderiales bacterium]|nr:UDP-N-acetylmuramoyl-L-alanyl-D-glutamate--2,6-diaminopimelate ligase [Burkholderiales bacterium]
MRLQRFDSPTAAAAWLRGSGARMLRTDSRRIGAGEAFVAWPGARTDGRRHVAAALAAGAAACLVEDAEVAAFGFDDARIATLAGLEAAAGEVADAFFGHPGAKLQVLAATGTNGKTSCAWWTAQALTRLGRRCGVVGTLGIGEPPAATVEPPAAVGEPAALESTGLTSPDAVTLHAAFAAFVERGFAACAIEASSIGLAGHRLDAAKIDVALFTNFTRDHLDFHGSMAAYWQAKRRLFDWPGLKAAVVNIDDEQGAALAAELAAGPRGLDLWSVSARAPARLAAEGLRYEAGGLAFELREQGGPALTARSRLIGDYNAHNLLGVIGGLRALGIPLADALAVLPFLSPVPGRMQRVAGGGVEVVVDYAHTPDALEKSLLALRPFAQARGGRLWCVFGCGGNRDATKRPLMGAIADRLADAVVATSDNPRDEAPGFILSQILAGVVGRDAFAVIEDRRAAIAHAVAQAVAGDVILLAGKGHEDYQEAAGRRLPFSDVDEARKALDRRAEARP